jgi:hypothetical protein
VAASLLLELERTVDAPQAAWLEGDAWLGVVNECHREVGVALARSWNMDEELLFAIARSDRFVGDSPSLITNVVCYTNALAKKAGVYVGEVEPVMLDALLREGASIFKLEPPMVESLLKELRTSSSQG